MAFMSQMRFRNWSIICFSCWFFCFNFCEKKKDRQHGCLSRPHIWILNWENGRLLSAKETPQGNRRQVNGWWSWREEAMRYIRTYSGSTLFFGTFFLTETWLPAANEVISLYSYWHTGPNILFRQDHISALASIFDQLPGEESNYC